MPRRFYSWCYSMKINKREKWLFICPALLLLLSILSRGSFLSEYWERIHLDHPEREAFEWAGWGATNCGDVGDSANAIDRAATDACVVKSFKARKPFRSRYNSKTGIRWVVGTPEGEIRLLYSPQPGDVYFRRECKNPKIVKVNGLERLQCASLSHVNEP